MDQPHAQPQFVMMPMPQRNALGVFGFFIALVGLVIPTGIVSLLGLVLSLAAIGRSPRGFAAFGVVLGLLGTVFWLSLMAIALVLGLAAAAVAAVVFAGAFVLTQPEVVELTTDMVNVAIAVEDYERQEGRIPEGMAALAVGTATTIDPWGGAYRLVPAEGEPGFDVVSGGADKTFDTDDDVRLSRLDRLWEDAMEGLEEKMEEFGRRLERIDGAQYGSRWGCGSDPHHDWKDYERKARRALTADGRGHGR